MDSKKEIQHVYLVGAKSLGAYGGYETFVYKLTEYHQNKENIKYHVACKANGDGCMDETKFDRTLQYFGRISLIILCIHGPVYRIVVKIVSILLNLGTDAVRENFLLAMVVVVITMAICSTAYEVVVRLAPWMVGKKKVKEN